MKGNFREREFVKASRRCKKVGAAHVLAWRKLPPMLKAKKDSFGKYTR